MYTFGALKMERGEIARRSGIRWTIKNDVVFDNDALMQEVAENWPNPVRRLFQ